MSSLFPPIYLFLSSPYTETILFKVISKLYVAKSYTKLSFSSYAIYQQHGTNDHFFLLTLLHLASRILLLISLLISSYTFCQILQTLECPGVQPSTSIQSLPILTFKVISSHLKTINIMVIHKCSSTAMTSPSPKFQTSMSSCLLHISTKI